MLFDAAPNSTKQLKQTTCTGVRVLCRCCAGVTSFAGARAGGGVKLVGCFYVVKGVFVKCW
jgi:hypothetical protein